MKRVCRNSSRLFRVSQRLNSSCPGYTSSCPKPLPPSGGSVPRSHVEQWKQPETYEQVRHNIVQATTIPPEAFYDESYFVAEQEQLFGNNWFAVAHAQELKRPGDTKVVNVGTQSFILTKDKKGKYNAFYNVCRHRGARILEFEDQATVQNRKRLNCPYHWWSYRLSGELVSTPFFDSDNFKKGDYSLLKVKVEEFAGILFLNQNPNNSKPLSSQLGQLNENFANYPSLGMNILRQQTYNLDVDWKLLAENFMEWYHVGPVHPELAKFSTMDKHHMNEGEGNYIGFVTAPVTNCGGPADTDLFNPTPNTTEEDHSTAYFYHIFPNVSVTVYPHSVYTLIMLPEAPGKCKETLYLLQHPECRLETDTDEEYDTKADKLMKFVTNVNDEDIYIVNRVSKGLRNTHYRGGRFAPDMEMTCYRFQNMLADAMIQREAIYPKNVLDYNEQILKPMLAKEKELQEKRDMFIAQNFAQADNIEEIIPAVSPEVLEAVQLESELAEGATPEILIVLPEEPVEEQESSTTS